MNKNLNIVTLPGDGIGVEIMPLIIDMLNASVSRYNDKNKTNLSFTFHHGDMGKGAYEKFGDALPEETLLLAKQHSFLFKGPTEAPEGLKPDGTQHTSVNVALRKAGDYYACVRPVFHLPNVPTNFKKPDLVNWVIFRENSEGLYGMPLVNEEESKLLIEYMSLHDKFKRVADALRRDGEQVLQFGTVSKKATYRIMKAAIEYALQHGQKNITILHKGNIFKEADGKFLKWSREVINEYDDKVTWWENPWKASKEEAENHYKTTGKIVVDTTIIDDFFAKSQMMPQNFSVLVTENFKGDVVSDFAAGLVGGLGVAPGSNINFENGNMLLEATHGTAPDIAGKNLANPTSMILSLMFGLQQVGGTWTDFANVLQKAIEQVYNDQYMTGDLARKIEGLQPVNLSAFVSLLKMAFANCLNK